MKKPKTPEQIKEAYEKAVEEARPEIVKNLQGYDTNGPYFRKMVEKMLENAYVYKPLKKAYIKPSGRFKCDAENCDFVTTRDDTPLEWYHLWRNVPCPKCGGNLYTDEDADSINALNVIMSWWVIRLFNWIGNKLKLRTIKVRIKMNGSGSLNLEVEKEN